MKTMATISQATWWIGSMWFPASRIQQTGFKARRYLEDLDMGHLSRFVCRWGLISLLAIGGITLVVGPQRVASGFAVMQNYAVSLFDDVMDDPVALRHQLISLADEYPDQIAEVRGELVEVKSQIEQYTHDLAIARRVVSLTSNDLSRLRTIVQAKVAQVPDGIRQIAFDGHTYDTEGAYREGRRIQTIRDSYRDRLSVDEQQLELLVTQEKRLVDILDRLDTEFTEYQSQLWQLDRQIDSIQRNERLIELTETQQDALRRYDRYGKVTSLEQIKGKLAEIRVVQESTLQALADQARHVDYETRAALEFEESGLSDPFESSDDSEPYIEFRPDPTAPEEETVARLRD